MNEAIAGGRPAWGGRGAMWVVAAVAVGLGLAARAPAGEGDRAGAAARSPATRPVPATRQVVLAPSGMPVWKVLADLNAADAGARQTAAVQLNSLGGDALRLVEAAAGRPDQPPETALALGRAVKLVRARAREEAARAAFATWVWGQVVGAYERGPAGAKPAYDAAVRGALDLWRALPPDPQADPLPDRRRAAADALADAVRKGYTPIIRSIPPHGSSPLVRVMTDPYSNSNSPSGTPAGMSGGGARSRSRTTSAHWRSTIES